MAGYIGNIPTPQATQSRQSFTATASQTTFATIGYTPNFVDVYLNGVHLLDGTDYTATNSSDVVLTVGAAVSDVIEVISYETFAVLDQTFVGATEVTSAGTTTLTVSSTGTGDADALLVLDSADGGESEVRFSHDGVHGASIQWYTDGSPDLNITTVAGTDGVIGFQPNNSNAMRIDASGNLLVGTTSTTAPIVNNGGAGVVIRGVNGQIYAGGADTQPLTLNRETSDGIIAQFRKDGVGVGSIGTSGGDLYVGTGDTTLKFSDAADVIVPTGTNGAARSGFLSLGNGSNKFKDLFLSGGVDFGGAVNSGSVVSSSNKLGDYEEGTWTPTLLFGGSSAGMVYGQRNGYYTKVGNMVTASCYILVSSKGTSTGAARLYGLPFTSNSATNAFTTGTFWVNTVTFTGVPEGYVEPNSTNFSLAYVAESGAATGMTNQNFFNGSGVMINVTYRV